MGQYHLCCNLDRKEWLDPHRLGDGLKLWEQGASQGGTLCALHALLVISNGRGGGDYITDHPEFVGRWGGDRIAVVGDYTEAGDLDGVDYAEFIYSACGTTKENAKEYYPTAKELKAALGPFKPGEWTDISDLARAFLSDQWELDFGDEGWVTRTPRPGSVFSQAEAAMKPDFIIGIE